MITVASLPLMGHALPMASVVRALTDFGEEVTWATGESVRSIVERAGATLWPLPFRPWVSAPTFHDAALQFVADSPEQVQACKGLPPGPILADPSMVGVHAYACAEDRHLTILGVFPFLGVSIGASGVLQATVEDFEPRVAWLDDPVTFVGPLVPRTTWETPPWWKDIPKGAPIVIVVQSTLAPDPRDLVIPALEGMQSVPVITIANADPSVGPYCAPWLPFGSMLHEARCLVTSGGYGGIQAAIKAGVPVVVVGEANDWALNGWRVEYSGIGKHLRPPYTPDRIRDAVVEVLLTPRFTERARELRDRCPKGFAEDRVARIMMDYRMREAA